MNRVQREATAQLICIVYLVVTCVGLVFSAKWAVALAIVVGAILAFFIVAAICAGIWDLIQRIVTGQGE